MAEKPSKETLFVKSKVHEYTKSKECNTSSGIIDEDAFNSFIIKLLDQAVP